VYLDQTEFKFGLYASLAVEFMRFSVIFTAHERCISYGNSVRLSVHPSVTRRYCVKTTSRSTVQFAPLDSKMCLVL